jgi:enoyl-CoA hydratase
MVFENVLYEVKDGILYLTLNRPEKNNALTPEMWNDIKNAAEEAWADNEVQVVIISGAGDKALASGADIKEIHDRESLRMLEGKSTIALKTLEDLYKPTICAINGFALGGGCELAMACDIRIATSRSRFGQPETGLGIMPGAGGTQRLARLVGPAKAKELIFTGRIIHADEAERIGLVNQVTGDSREELMEAAETMARRILAKGPVATRLAKMCINTGLDTDINTGLLFERIAQTVAFCTEDRLEGTAAFLEKRPAEFKGQ